MCKHAYIHMCVYVCMHICNRYYMHYIFKTLRTIKPKIMFPFNLGLAVNNVNLRGILVNADTNYSSFKISEVAKMLCLPWMSLFPFLREYMPRRIQTHRSSGGELGLAFHAETVCCVRGSMGLKSD